MSMYFDGATQYGHIPTEALYSSAAPYSIAVWVKPDTGFATEMHVAGPFNATTLNHFSGCVLRGDQATKTLSKYKSSSTLYTMSSASYVPSTSSWNLWFFSRNGTTTSASACRYFVNGSAVGTNTAEEQTATNINKFGFAARRVSTGSYQNFFKGKIGCVAVWNRQLNTTEETALQGGAHPSTISSGLVDIFEWNGTGSPATSTSVNGRVVTWVGSPPQDTDSPFPSITSVGSSGAFSVGQSAIPITTAGMSALSSVTVGDAFTTLTGTSLTGSVGSYTFNLQSWSDNTAYPDIGTVTVTASDGTPRTTSGTLQLPVNFASTTIVNAVTTDPTYIGYTVNPLPDNRKIYYPTANGLVITSEGGVTCNGEMTTIIWIHNLETSGDRKVNSYTLNVTTGGVVTVTPTISTIVTSNITFSVTTSIQQIH